MIWYPFTNQEDAPPPIHIERGNAEFVFDKNGKRYIDAISSWWTMVHGHNHPHIKDKIIAQLNLLDHVMLADFTHTPAAELAEKLIAVNNGYFKKVFYSDNGSTAVEVMLKLAVQYWHNIGQKDKNIFIKFDTAYHGDTIGSMSVAASSIFTQPFTPLLFETKTFFYPRQGEDEANGINEKILEDIELYLKENHRRIAGIVLEPLVAAAGGMVFGAQTALRRIYSLSRKYDVLLLFDEVFTGMGRTGKMFAYQKVDVFPDIIALSKGLTGGVLPLAATLVTERIHKAFISKDPSKTFYHGHTMTGNPLASSAALASLEIFEKDNVLEKVTFLEKYLKDALQNLQTKYPSKITNTRALGSVAAFDLLRSEGKTGYVFSQTQSIKAKAVEAGVILRPLGNVIYVTPPYLIQDSSLDKIFSVIDYIVETYES